MTDFTTITACGECCVGCSKKIEGSCPGCVEADGRVPEWAQNILWQCYEKARGVENISKICGVPAYYVEDRIRDLLKRNALTETLC